MMPKALDPICLAELQSLGFTGFLGSQSYRNQCLPVSLWALVIREMRWYWGTQGLQQPKLGVMFFWPFLKLTTFYQTYKTKSHKY